MASTTTSSTSTPNNLNAPPTTTASSSIYKFTSHPSTTPLQIPAQQHILALAQAQAQNTPSRPPVSYIAVGALTFHPQAHFHGQSTSAEKSESQDKEQRILLLQRASTDSMPNLWEIPGGACDDDDTSILHSVARELHEEAGVVARTIGPLVELVSLELELDTDTDAQGEAEAQREGYVFWTRSGKLVRKYNFLVELDLGLDDAGEREGEGLLHGGSEAATVAVAENVQVKLDPAEHRNYVWATEGEVRARRCGDVELRFTSPEQLGVILAGFEVRRGLVAGLGRGT